MGKDLDKKNFCLPLVLMKMDVALMENAMKSAHNTDIKILT